MGARVAGEPVEVVERGRAHPPAGGEHAAAEERSDIPLIRTKQKSPGNVGAFYMAYG